MISNDPSNYNTFVNRWKYSLKPLTNDFVDMESWTHCSGLQHSIEDKIMIFFGYFKLKKSVLTFARFVKLTCVWWFIYA